MHVFESEPEEAAATAKWIAERIKEGVAPEATAVLVRSENELQRAAEAVRLSGAEGVMVAQMHDAKGREFRTVAVMACDANVIPREERILSATDARSLREVYDTERHLLYVAATRAREFLWTSACNPASEFLEDLMEAS